MKKFYSLNPSKEDLPVNYNISKHGIGPFIKFRETKSELGITIIFAGFYSNDIECIANNQKKTFKKIKIPGLGKLFDSGSPELPAFGKYLKIPRNLKKDRSVNVTMSNETDFEDFLIFPSQVDEHDQHKVEYLTKSFEYNIKVYNSDSEYPGFIHKITDENTVLGIRSILLYITPFKYYPKKRLLKGYSRIHIQIIKENIDLFEEYKSAIYSNTTNLDLRKLYFNLDRYHPEAGISYNTQLSGYLFSVDYYGPEFLIICAPQFSGTAQKLADWKNKKGILTEFISLATSDNNVEAIKSKIRTLTGVDSYSTGIRFPRLRYVLLIGDIDEIKSEQITGYVTGSGLSWPDYFSDFYYSTHTDPVSNNDVILPFLSIGRIPVKTQEEASHVIEKIISYEKKPPYCFYYYRHLTFAGYLQDSDPQDNTDDRDYIRTLEEIIQSIRSWFFPRRKFERIYTAQHSEIDEYDDGSTIPNVVTQAVCDETIAGRKIKKAFKKGRLIIAHRDHGDVEGWAHPLFTSNDLDDLIPKRPSVVFSINCLSGSFFQVPEDCFGEVLLKQKNGTPSLIASCALSNSGPSNQLLKGCFDAIWNSVIDFPDECASYEPLRAFRIGDILLYAKAYLKTRYLETYPAALKNMFQIFHVLGDPTLEIWKNKPRKICIRVFLQSEAAVNYLLVRLRYCPQDARLVLYHNDTHVQTVKLYSNQHIFSLNNIEYSSGDIFYIYFSAPGYRFKEFTIDIT